MGVLPRLQIAVIIGGGVLVFLGFQEYRVSTGASSQPANVNLADLESGKKPGNNHVRIGTHLALFDQSVFSYKKKFGGQPGPSTRVEVLFVPIVSGSGANASVESPEGASPAAIAATDTGGAGPSREERKAEDGASAFGTSPLVAADGLLAQFTPGNRPGPPAIPPVVSPPRTRPPFTNPNLPSPDRQTFKPPDAPPVLPPGMSPSPANPLPSVNLSRCVVIVKTWKYETLGTVPQGAVLTGSVQGLFINSISSLGSKEQKLLASALPSVDLNKVYILQEGRQPSSVISMFLLFFGGIALAAVGFGWMVVTRAS